MGKHITQYIAVAVLLISGTMVATGADVGGTDDAKGAGCPKRSLMFAYGARAGESTDDGSSGGKRGDVAPSLRIDYSSRGDGSIGWETGISYALHQEFIAFGDTEDMEVIEVSLGGRLTYQGFAGNRGGLLPYASAGVSGLILGGRSDSAAVGVYSRGGLNYVFGGGFTAGCELKGLISSSDDLDYYVQFAIQLGWSF